MCPSPQFNNRPHSILTLQLLLNRLDLFRGINLNDPSNLTLIAHQLLRAGVQHARLLVARRGQVVEHHVGHAEAAGLERQRVREQHEAGRVVRQLVAEVLHVFVDLVVGAADLEGLFVDLVFLEGRAGID